MNSEIEYYDEVFENLEHQRINRGETLFSYDTVWLYTHQAYYHSAEFLDEEDELIHSIATPIWKNYIEYLKSIDENMEYREDADLVILSNHKE